MGKREKSIILNSCYEEDKNYKKTNVGDNRIAYFSGMMLEEFLMI